MHKHGGGDTLNESDVVTCEATVLRPALGRNDLHIIGHPNAGSFTNLVRDLPRTGWGACAVMLSKPSGNEYGC